MKFRQLIGFGVFHAEAAPEVRKQVHNLILLQVSGGVGGPINNQVSTLVKVMLLEQLIAEESICDMSF